MRAEQQQRRMETKTHTHTEREIEKERETKIAFGFCAFLFFFDLENLPKAYTKQTQMKKGLVKRTSKKYRTHFCFDEHKIKAKRSEETNQQTHELNGRNQNCCVCQRKQYL